MKRSEHMINEVRDRLETFTEWSTRTTQNLIISLTALWGGALILLILATWIPSTVTKGAIERAQIAVSESTADVTNASTRFKNESKWPLPRYTEGLAGIVADADRWVSDTEWTDENGEQVGAQKALALAQAGNWNPDTTLYWAKVAQENADLAKQLGAVVTGKLDVNAKLQNDARLKISETDKLLSNANTSRSDAQSRLNKERGDFLSKYSVSLDKVLLSANDSQTKGQGYLDAAIANMPPADDIWNLGDPDTALVELLKAKMEIDKINVLAGEVTSGLDLQKTAKAEAGTQTAQAEIEVRNAWATIQNVANTRGYTLDKALAQANSLYNQANSQQQLAAVTLVSPIESEGGKLDFLLAYQSALEALKSSGKVNTEVKMQTDTADEAQTKISKYPSTLTAVNTVVDQADRDRSGLTSNHAQGTWSDVANAAESAREYIRQAAIHFDNAVREVSLQFQQFVLALKEANLALDSLESARLEAQSVINRYGELENLRLIQWPAAESSAVSAINSAGPTVSIYSGYSYRAVSELSNANGSLSSARTYAMQLQWQSAIDSAGTAYTQANNAASWAQSDYDDEIDRQAAERQRQIDAENQRIADQQSSDNSYDNSSPSYDNSYDGGTSSDSNSFDDSGSDNNSWDE